MINSRSFFFGAVQVFFKLQQRLYPRVQSSGTQWHGESPRASIFKSWSSVVWTPRQCTPYAGVQYNAHCTVYTPWTVKLNLTKLLKFNKQSVQSIKFGNNNLNVKGKFQKTFQSPKSAPVPFQLRNLLRSFDPTFIRSSYSLTPLPNPFYQHAFLQVWGTDPPAPISQG